MCSPIFIDCSLETTTVLLCHSPSLPPPHYLTGLLKQTLPSLSWKDVEVDVLVTGVWSSPLLALALQSEVAFLCFLLPSFVPCRTQLWCRELAVKLTKETGLGQLSWLSLFGWIAKWSASIHSMPAGLYSLGLSNLPSLTALASEMLNLCVSEQDSASPDSILPLSCVVAGSNLGNQVSGEGHSTAPTTSVGKVHF